MLHLFATFHLNLAYSSLEEAQRPAVIERCYWPLLRLAATAGVPVGIEASGCTLERIAALDPSWIAELRRLIQLGACEFIASGYAQVIGPLVPAEVVAMNLRIGWQTYERLLGRRFPLALVNEQAYSAGLPEHYLAAGSEAIIMEWENAARYHPEWDSEWRYLPQRACGQHGEAVPVIWNNSISFQKLQRYAHGEIDLDEYLRYLQSLAGAGPRVLAMYGNDAEIFDFRPGRYRSEAPLQQGEWARLALAWQAVRHNPQFTMIAPSQVLAFLVQEGAGHLLHLESPEQPTPVKKQEKYNITRWAVTGRNDLGINAMCWRIFETLVRRPDRPEREWRELCYLWGSDFRTHIGEERWCDYRRRLTSFAAEIGVTPPRSAQSPSPGASHSLPPTVRVERVERYLTVATDSLRLKLDCRRGLAIDALGRADADQPLCGKIPHGYYDNIAWGADFFTGHLVFQSPGHPKITDLEPVDPVIEWLPESNRLVVRAEVQTELGPIEKRIAVAVDQPRIEIGFRLLWESVPVGSLRIGHVTLLPNAFDRSSLFYRTHNGGSAWERFALSGHAVDHGSPVSFLVSASQGVGMTRGVMEIGDRAQSLRIETDPQLAPLLGLVTYRELRDVFFLRVAFSAGEIDDTRHTFIDNAGDIRCAEFQIALVVPERKLSAPPDDDRAAPCAQRHSERTAC